MIETKTVEQLAAENEALRERLAEAEETLDAIRSGRVDAFLMADRDCERVFTLEFADQPYRVWSEQMGQSAVTLTADGTILYCNRRCADLLHVPREQMFGLSFLDFLKEGDAPRLRALLEQGGEGHAEELELRRADGGCVPVQLSVRPLLTESAAAFSVLVTDLTERKHLEELERAQEALRHSEARLQRALQEVVAWKNRYEAAILATRQVLYDWDSATNEVAYGGSLWETLGWTADELAGGLAHWLTLIHPDDRGAFEQEIGRVLAQRAPFDLEYRVRRKDGTWVVLQDNGRFFLDAGGTSTRMVGFRMDITQRRQAEEALREADRRKDEFITLLAHELRNPLMPIRNMAQVIKRAGPTDPELQRARDLIERQVAHMARLIDDLLDVSRIVHGKVRLRLEPCDFKAVVQQTVQDYRCVLEQNGLQLNLSLPAGSLWVRGDATRLAQVVGNVLQNAAKFTSAGGRVEVRLGAEDGRAVLRIRDTGIGMKPEMLARIFDTFTQAERGLERSRGGLGLGLALVRGLVQLHGGTVRAASEGPGRGTEITIELPLGDAAAPADPAPKAPAPAAAFRILVIEDNYDAAESMKMLLELEGHTVHLEMTGPAGVEAARRFRPQVVLCDIGLPGGMDGFAAARALRQEPATAHAYLVALTGYGEEEFAQRTREAGFDLHMVKPVQFTELQAMLATLAK